MAVNESAENYLETILMLSQRNGNSHKSLLFCLYKYDKSVILPCGDKNITI